MAIVALANIATLELAALMSARPMTIVAQTNIATTSANATTVKPVRRTGISSLVVVRPRVVLIRAVSKNLFVEAAIWLPIVP